MRGVSDFFCKILVSQRSVSSPLISLLFINDFCEIVLKLGIYHFVDTKNLYISVKFTATIETKDVTMNFKKLG